MAGLRVAVITGASRGVGRATALGLAERGLFPVLLARPSDALEETGRLLAGRGYGSTSVACELGEPRAVAAAAARVLEEHGAPEVLVHAAGVVERAPVAELGDAAWERQLEVNLSAPFRLTRALLPAMLAERRGRVVFVSSISAVVGTAQQSAYNASKAGLVALMRCLGEELKDTGLMTAALLPGAIDTDMLRGSGYAPRMSAEEVARTLVYLALDASPAHNGGALEMFGV
jgi:3-oxoacyl-[acyl-carrier protein] reductase